MSEALIMFGTVEKALGYLGKPSGSIKAVLSPDQKGLRLFPASVALVGGKGEKDVTEDTQLLPGQKVEFVFPSITNPKKVSFLLSANPALHRLGFISHPAVLGHHDLAESGLTVKLLLSEKIKFSDLTQVWALELRAL